jgi:hypothetical protein
MNPEKEPVVADSLANDVAVCLQTFGSSECAAFARGHAAD